MRMAVGLEDGLGLDGDRFMRDTPTRSNKEMNDHNPNVIWISSKWKCILLNVNIFIRLA